MAASAKLNIGLKNIKCWPPITGIHIGQVDAGRVGRHRAHGILRGFREVADVAACMGVVARGRLRSAGAEVHVERVGAERIVVRLGQGNAINDGGVNRVLDELQGVR